MLRPLIGGFCKIANPKDGKFPKFRREAPMKEDRVSQPQKFPADPGAVSHHLEYVKDLTSALLHALKNIFQFVTDLIF
jgi:hypothetical protein